MKEILDVIHNTIYQFFDVCSDDEEVPMSDKDKLLLEVNKAICNNLKALEQQPCEDCVSREALRNLKISVPIAPVFTDDNYIKYRDAVFYDDIIDLPSVTPKGVTITDFADRCRECGRIKPCEDCISREAVIKHICESKECYKDECKGRLYKRCFDLQWIYDLSSVTPKTKIGQWIEEKNDYGEITHWHCSKCYDDSGFITTCKWDFCPNCGADMRGEAE